MYDEVVAHMRDRVAQLRKVVAIAHDPRIIEIIERMIEEAEVDIRQLEVGEAKQAAGKSG